MAETIPGLIVQIGTRSSDAIGTNVGISDSTPFLQWSLPSGTQQGKFRVNIEYMGGDHTAKITTGAHTRSDTSYQIEPPEAMTRLFYGLCRVYIEISADAQSGTFEFQSEYTYFVFDPNLERFVQADAVTIKWDKPTDPDSLPVGIPYFQLQISTVPTMDSNLVYDNAVIAATTGLHQTFIVPSGSFTADEDKYYFYRVRMNDGLDWGNWSQVNAFISRSAAPPALTIDDVVNSHNANYDVMITFTLRGTSDFYSVSFLGSGDEIGTDPVPLYLINPTVRVAPGTYTVAWRTCTGEDTTVLPQATPNQIGKNRAYVTIQAIAKDIVGTVGSVTYGPFLVDNLYQPYGGGVGSTEYTYPIRLGQVRLQPTIGDFPSSTLPIVGALTKGGGKVSMRLREPIAFSPLVYRQSYVVGSLEPRPQGNGVQGGFGHALLKKNFWPQPMAPNNIYGGPTWNVYPGLVTTQRAIPVDLSKSFVFQQPFDFTDPSTLPEPFPSNEWWMWKKFLKGYIDLDGIEQVYPDGYDWTNRPVWHYGREVWGEDDGWVQVATYGVTDCAVCTTCHGRGWLARGDAIPYSRVECTNDSCINGFDKSTVQVATVFSTVLNKNVKMVNGKWFVDVKWHRFSRWYGTPYKEIGRYGMDITGGVFAHNRLHVVGHSPSFSDAVFGLDNHGNSFLKYYLIEIEDGTLKEINAAAPLVHNELSDSKTIQGRPSRQFSSPKIHGWSKPGVSGSLNGMVTDDYPVIGTMTDHIVVKDPTPVQGLLGATKLNYHLGQGDPDSDIYMGGRPHPTQPGSLRIGGEIGYNFHTQDLKIRFLQQWWDAYNTLHAQYTAGDAIQLHWQYTELGQVNWRDVKPDNATFHPTLANTNGQQGVYLTDALGFHAYWNTIDPLQFVEGQSYKLRVRYINVPAASASAFVEAPLPFAILHGVSNPVNVIGTDYEPWSKVVTITFRVDDTQNDAYTITRIWWTKESSGTIPDTPWNLISLGDIAGEVSYLSAKPGENVHQIKWFTSGASLTAGNTFRLRIEAIPTGLTEKIVLPFFKWLSPRNPYIDRAELDLADMLGTVNTQYFDSVTNTYKPYNPPKYSPGQLFALQQEYERVKDDPTVAAPSGYYSFWVPAPTGEILVDPSGYQIWLQGKYGTETHTLAMNRIATQIDSMVRVQIPAAQNILTDGEEQIRKTLIEQGYYAEQQFKYVDPSGYREVVNAIPVQNRRGATLPTTVERWWQFRVQSTALGGDNVFNNGIYNPDEITELEQVWYKVQMDGFDTFDSQAFKKPLREFIFNHLNERISVAEFFGGKTTTSTNPAVDGPASQSIIDPTTGQPFPNQTGPAVDTSLGGVTQVGGVLKLLPEVLPGEIETTDIQPYANPAIYPPQVGAGQQPDVLPIGVDDWNGNYMWRVAAYNKITGVVYARPRPLINSVSYAGGEFVINYTSQAHSDIVTMSLTHSFDFFGALHVQGYMISTQNLVSPQWVSMDLVPTDPFTMIDFVSDRRANSLDPTRKPNPINWIPAGTNRPHPWAFYDEIKQQYVMFQTKQSYDLTYRIVGARAMNWPEVCETGTYFIDEPAQRIYAPCVVYEPVTGVYHMWATKTPVNGDSYIVHATSFDAENWDFLTSIDGIPSGTKGSVCRLNDIWHMWYQRDINGVQTIFYATSQDGISFTIQNSGSGVYDDGGNPIDKPCVIRIGSSWVMYFSDLTMGKICSLISSDGINWTGRRVEISPFTVLINSTPTVVPVSNACVFYDRFYGNQELFMVFNLIYPGGINRTAIARQENRIWVWGDDAATVSSNNNRIDVPSSNVGIPRQMSFNAGSNGLGSSDNPKVRFVFSTFTPTAKEYHRQSAWVDVTNVADLGAFLNPDPYYYDVQVKGYNYIRQFSDI